MAVATDFQQLRSSLAVTHYDFDPDATSATDVGWVDMRDFDAILISFFRTVGTSSLTLNILGNTEADGSGTDATIKAVTISAQPDAVGDYVFAEVTAQEIAQAATDAGLDGLRGVSASAAVATAGDEGVFTYVRSGKRKHKDLSVDSVA